MVYAGFQIRELNYAALEEGVHVKTRLLAGLGGHSRQISVGPELP